MFPGQGSHAGDMCQQVERWCPELGEGASRELGQDPFQGAAGSTALAQPAIYCASIAGWRALAERLQPAAVAGHSLGEFAALVAAGSLDPLDGLRLVVLRGRLMQEAQDRQNGGMIAVSGPSLDRLPRLAERCGVVVANDNSPSQVVLSGPTAALKAACEAVKAAGLRAVELPVGGAFHSPQMSEVRDSFREAMAEVEIQSPKLLALCTTTCAPFTKIKDELADGIVRPVLWRQSVEALCRLGFQRFVEAGPGRVLSKLVKRTAGDSVDVAMPVDVV